MKQFNNLNNESSYRDLIYALAVLIFVYVLLFEFILPINKILPKPSLLLESFGALWESYNLLVAFSLTTAVCYLALIIGYLFIVGLSGILIKVFFEFGGIFNGLKIFRYFQALFFAVLFAFWFPGSVLAESIFALLIVIFYLGLSLHNETQSPKSEYIDAARSLGIEKGKLYSNIIWKCSQPAVFESMHRLHNYLWGTILIFEFVGELPGFGGVYRKALYFNDLGAIISLSVIIALLIWIGNMLINYFKSRLIFWEL